VLVACEEEGIVNIHKNNVPKLLILLFRTIVSAAEDEAAVLTWLPQEARLFLPHLVKLLPLKLQHLES
jgi:uncharacterized protein YbaA (DUF1428 family)